MGIWSCLGKTLDEVRDALYAGKSGIVCRISVLKISTFVL